MKKIIVFVLSLCLCFTVFGGFAFAESAVADVPAAEMTAEELYQTGLDALDAEDYGKAMEYYQLAADLGVAAAWRSIGYLYDYGYGVEQDYDKALEYYLLAADQGDPGAMFNIGLMYNFGEGVEQDYSKAAEYYQKAADQEDAEALLNLGILYCNGTGVEQDFSKAYDCLLRSAAQGIPNAMFDLGVCFYEGLGVEKDPDQAAEWYRKALEAGYEPQGEEEQARLKEALGDDYTQK